MTESDLKIVFTLAVYLSLMSFYSVDLFAQGTQATTQETSQVQSEADQSVAKPATETGSTNTEKPGGSDSKDKFDVDVLVERMKETKAIGVITKLSLKNQVDDLLEKAEEIKQNDKDTTDEKSELREDFEGLILKTVSLLNKGEDYSLAEDIYLAREELWQSIMENKA